MKIVAILLLFFPLAYNCLVQSSPSADPNIAAEPNGLSETDYFPRQIVTGPKAWGLACCALLTEHNHDWHDTLAFEPKNAVLIQNQKKGLSEWWGIENKADLIRNLTWLENEGHRAGFEKLGRQIQNLNFAEFSEMLQKTTDQEQLNRLHVAHKYYSELGQKGLTGWDFERAIYLCRAGYECGYLSEKEAWDHIMIYAQILQQTFDSWEDLGRNYLIGRTYWSYSNTLKTGSHFDDNFMMLTEMPSSPWNRLDWNMDLRQTNSDSKKVSEPNQAPNDVR